MIHGLISLAYRFGEFGALVQVIAARGLRIDA